MKRFLIVVILVSVLLSPAQTPAQAGGPILESSSDHQQLSFVNLPNGTFTIVYGISGQAEVSKNYLVTNNSLVVDTQAELGDSVKYLVSIHTSVFVSSDSPLWENQNFDWLILKPTLRVTLVNSGLKFESAGLWDFPIHFGVSMEAEKIFTIKTGVTVIETPPSFVSWIETPFIPVTLDDQSFPFWKPESDTNWHIRNPMLDILDISLTGSPRAAHFVSLHGQQFTIIASLKGEPVILTAIDKIIDIRNWDKFTLSPDDVVNQWIQSTDGSILGWNYQTGTTPTDPGQWIRDRSVTITYIYLPLITK